MKQALDVYQRKIYALTRMNLAMGRMNRETNEMARARALFWVNAWLVASGLRQFKLGARSKKLSPPPSRDASQGPIRPGSERS